MVRFELDSRRSEIPGNGCTDWRFFNRDKIPVGRGWLPAPPPSEAQRSVNRIKHAQLNIVGVFPMPHGRPSVKISPLEPCWRRSAQPGWRWASVNTASDTWTFWRAGAGNVKYSFPPERVAHRSHPKRLAEDGVVVDSDPWARW